MEDFIIEHLYILKFFTYLLLIINKNDRVFDYLTIIYIGQECFF